MKAGVCFVYTVERHIHIDRVISDCLEIIHEFKIQRKILNLRVWRRGRGTGRKCPHDCYLDVVLRAYVALGSEKGSKSPHRRQSEMGRWMFGRSGTQRAEGRAHSKQVKVKSSLCLIQHQGVGACRGVEYSAKQS